MKPQMKHALGVNNSSCPFITCPLHSGEKVFKIHLSYPKNNITTHRISKIPILMFLMKDNDMLNTDIQNHNLPYIMTTNSSNICAVKVTSHIYIYRYTVSQICCTRNMLTRIYPGNDTNNDNHSQFERNVKSPYL